MLNFLLGKMKKPQISFRELADAGAVILDVRTPAEFRSGHIQGAVNIPLDELKAGMAGLKKRGKPVITCCRSGARSALACQALKKAGLEAYNGGAWNSLEKLIK